MRRPIGVDRRTLIKRAAALGAAAWTAPVILDSLGSPAAAVTGAECLLYVLAGSAQGNGPCDAFTIASTGTCASPTSTTCSGCTSNCASGTSLTRQTTSGTAAPSITGCSEDPSGSGTITLGTATVAAGCTIIGYATRLTTCFGATAVALTPGSGTATQNLGSLTGKNTSFFVYLLVECT